MDICRLIQQAARAEQPRFSTDSSKLSPAGQALARLQVSERDVPSVLRLLAAENPNVRYQAVRVVESLGDDQVWPHLPALLPLLDDPHHVVRELARSKLRRIRPRPLSVLRELRRAPGPHRRSALTGLAEVVGWHGLDAADQALVRRLIRIKTPRETLVPFEPDGQWYALPTGDQAAVLDALDLSDPMPVTMRLGRAAASNRYVLEDRVAYVTPMLDGWTLVFMWDSEDEVRVADLSRRFGAAHGYVRWEDYHGCGVASGWSVAEHGTVVRYYSYHGAGELEVGTPLPAEQGYVLPHQIDAPDDVDICGALEIAARISVDLTAIGPQTRVEGQPIIALTAAGRSEGILPGALPV